jgi:hypothetical protein
MDQSIRFVLPRTGITIDLRGNEPSVFIWKEDERRYLLFGDKLDHGFKMDTATPILGLIPGFSLRDKAAPRVENIDIQ